MAASPRPELAALGLSAGERVRWRKRPRGRWREGTVVERERDGSVSVRDGNGAVLTRWEMPHAHGMGIDSNGNIYVGRTKELRVDKYVRVH